MNSKLFITICIIQLVYSEISISNTNGYRNVCKYEMNIEYDFVYMT